MPAPSRARQFHEQQVHFIRKNLSFSDVDTAGSYVGTVPAGSIINRITTVITTAFNAGTTNTLSVGKTAGGTDYVNAIAAGSATGPTAATVSAANVLTAADQDIFVSYASTGAAATAGAATVIIEYIPNI